MSADAGAFSPQKKKKKKERQRRTEDRTEVPLKEIKDTTAETCDVHRDGMKVCFGAISVLVQESHRFRPGMNKWFIDRRIRGGGQDPNSPGKKVTTNKLENTPSIF